MNRRQFGKLISLAALGGYALPNFRWMIPENPGYRSERSIVNEMAEMMRITEHWIRRAQKARGGDFQLFRNRGQWASTVRASRKEIRDSVRMEHRMNIGMALVYSMPIKHPYALYEGPDGKEYEQAIEELPSWAYTFSMQGFVNKFGRLPTMLDAHDKRIYVEYVPGRFLSEHDRTLAHMDVQEWEMISELRLHMP